MFGMNKILSKHLKVASEVTGMEHVEDEDELIVSSSESENENELESKKASSSKKQKRTNSAFNRPMQLSTKLAQLLGTDTLSRPQVVKHIWEYIKTHELQDPKDKRFILCDEALEKIFKQKRVSSFGMNSTLSLHLTKMESSSSNGISKSSIEFSFNS